VVGSGAAHVGIKVPHWSAQRYRSEVCTQWPRRSRTTGVWQCRQLPAVWAMAGPSGLFIEVTDRRGCATGGGSSALESGSLGASDGPMSTDEGVGGKVAAARKARGLSQRELVSCVVNSWYKC